MDAPEAPEAPEASFAILGDELLYELLMKLLVDELWFAPKRELQEKRYFAPPEERMKHALRRRRILIRTFVGLAGTSRRIRGMLMDPQTRRDMYRRWMTMPIPGFHGTLEPEMRWASGARLPDVPDDPPGTAGNVLPHGWYTRRFLPTALINDFLRWHYLAGVRRRRYQSEHRRLPASLKTQQRLGMVTVGREDYAFRVPIHFATRLVNRDRMLGSGLGVTSEERKMWISGQGDPWYGVGDNPLVAPLIRALSVTEAIRLPTVRFPDTANYAKILPRTEACVIDLETLSGVRKPDLVVLVDPPVLVPVYGLAREKDEAKALAKIEWFHTSVGPMQKGQYLVLKHVKLAFPDHFRMRLEESVASAYSHVTLHFDRLMYGPRNLLPEHQPNLGALELDAEGNAGLRGVPITVAVDSFWSQGDPWHAIDRVVLRDLPKPHEHTVTYETGSEEEEDFLEMMKRRRGY